MTPLTKQIEAMRVRLSELGTQEHGLVRMLGDALAAVDQRLLEDVRNVAAAHDARRGVILRELQLLAGRMGSLHSPQAPVAALEDASHQELSDRTESAPEEPSQGIESVLNGGADWRLAAANIRDELDNHFRTQPQISHVGH